MKLVYPSHLGKSPELIQGTGNAVIPEGTRVSWILHTLSTSAVRYYDHKNFTYFTAPVF